MSGILNQTGAVSGILGTTVGTPSSNAADIGAGVLPVGVTGGSGLDATPLSHRNLIINGGMQVWQRATATTTVSSGYYTVDRWAMYVSGAATVTSEKHNMSVTELNTTGHRTALQLNCTVADGSLGSGDYIFLRTSLEGQNLQHLQYGSASAKDITLSFWVKSDATGTYCVALNKNSGTRTQIPLEYTISSADTWEKKTITVTPTMGSTSLIAVAAGVIDNDNVAGLSINFTLMAGSSSQATADTWVASGAAWGTSGQTNWAAATNNFYITGIQLETGSVATPFEHRGIGDELRRCQRYYWRMIDGTISAPLGMGTYYAAAEIYGTINFITEMRADPTAEQNTGTDYFQIYRDSASDPFNGFSFRKLTPFGCIYYQGSNVSGTAGHAGWVESRHASARLSFTAEL